MAAEVLWVKMVQFESLMYRNRPIQEASRPRSRAAFFSYFSQKEIGSYLQHQTLFSYEMDEIAMALSLLRILFYLDTHSGFIRTLFRSAIFSKIGIIFLLFCDHLSHGFTHHFDAVSTINQAIHYCIGNCWVANYVKPLF